MEENIHFETYKPSNEKYFQIAEEDETMKEYVYFTKHDSGLIFLDSECVGFYKLEYLDYDLGDMEIFIAIRKEYRGQGIAVCALKKLAYNIFSNNERAHIRMSIDKDNTSSIKMAEKAGFKRNIEEEKELREYNDNKTLIYLLESRDLDFKRGR